MTSRFDAARRGNTVKMQWRKRIRFDRDGVSIAADVNAAVTVNRDEPGTTNETRSVSHARVVQDSRPADESGAVKEPEAERNEPE
jgi:hypothetical protein